MALRFRAKRYKIAIVMTMVLLFSCTVYVYRKEVKSWIIWHSFWGRTSKKVIVSLRDHLVDIERESMKPDEKGIIGYYENTIDSIECFEWWDIDKDMIMRDKIVLRNRFRIGDVSKAWIFTLDSITSITPQEFEAYADLNIMPDSVKFAKAYNLKLSRCIQYTVKPLMGLSTKMVKLRVDRRFNYFFYAVGVEYILKRTPEGWDMVDKKPVWAMLGNPPPPWWSKIACPRSESDPINQHLMFIDH
ncbi:hypothetical protein DRO29_07370 [Candidatus Bathyarchaeota archaeon]|nr:MAG: hypothetical protein DRO29_07370 [Candidatus Bathyarchaeota archaeon]